MGVILLYIKAQLKGVGSLKLPDGYSYCIDVKDSVGDDVRKEVFVDNTEEHELTGSKGTAHFYLKWSKDSKKEAYLNLVDVKGVTRGLTGEDSGDWVPIMGFEGRGMEPVGFHPKEGWIVEGEKGFKFDPDEVDLSDDWCDFDEKTNDTIEITEFEWKFEAHKGKGKK